MELRTADFDFFLPEALIAQEPARPRDAARLLVVDDALRDMAVRDLPALLQPGDLMVVNDTQVIPARLVAFRGEARIEVMLNRAEGGGVWHALLRNSRRLRAGDVLRVPGSSVTARVLEAPQGGAARLDLGPDEAALAEALAAVGEIPLPPYITRPDGPRATDSADYQTAFASKPGAVAAPTASLHFTPELLAALAARGVQRAELTLHVGAGTFLPVKVEDVTTHRMHAEWGEVTQSAADVINATRAAGGRIIPVGTTALRLIESAATPEGQMWAWQGTTDIFIYPGYRFRVTDALMTNFHLPKSTLLMLVAALMGQDRMRRVYAHAIDQGYRFFSYGDASLLIPDGTRA